MKILITLKSVYLIFASFVLGYIIIRSAYFICIFFLIPDYYTPKNIMNRISNDPLDWVQYPSPRIDVDALHRPFSKWSYREPNFANYCANSSYFEWEVYTENGNALVNIKEEKRLKCKYRDIYYLMNENESYHFPKVDTSNSDIPNSGVRHIFKLSDGWLVGYNHGEFGGNSWWFSHDGQEKYKISNKHIRKYFIWDDVIYALEGLAHGTISEGGIITISQNTNQHWERNILVELPAAPYASVKYDDYLYVVTSDMLIIKISMVGTMVNIVSDEDEYWWGLYPNSIVIDKNRNIFVGMRQGIAMYPMDQPESGLKWLVPGHKYMRQELIRFRKKVSRMGYIVAYELPHYFNRVLSHWIETWNNLRQKIVGENSITRKY